MNPKLRDKLRKIIEETLTYDEDAWSTAAFNSFIDQYRLDYKSKNGRLPSQEHIDKFARRVLEEENWIEHGKSLYIEIIGKIVDQLSKSISSYAWKQNLKDRALALSIMAISIFTCLNIYQQEKIEVLYGALSLAAVVSFIFSVKIIWNSMNLKE